MHAWRASFEARMDQMHDACMSALHGRAWGLEEDVAAHVQWSEAAGKNKLTANEVNDIRGMLQVGGEARGFGASLEGGFQTDVRTAWLRMVHAGGWSPCRQRIQLIHSRPSN